MVGHGKASLLVCVSQAPYLFDESLHVLKFAAIASKVSVEEFKVCFTFYLVFGGILIKIKEYRWHEIYVTLPLGQGPYPDFVLGL